MTTVLDVVDDYFLLRPDRDPRTVAGRQLFELGDAVRAFAASNATPQVTAGQRVYLGGWASASFWAVNGDMLLSSLLYSDQVVIKDPLSDWFSDDRYRNLHLMGARPGYRTDDKPNALETRAFLANVLPALDALRPLIEAGLVVLVPSEQFYRRQREGIEALERALADHLLDDVVGYSQRFRASDLAVEDNLRGLFIFAGGDREEQLANALQHAFRYFAREYALAQWFGATYTAPFAHEQFMARHGLNEIARPSARVAHALLASNLPIFSGLTPDVLAKMHQDDAFAAFRQELHQLYSGAPVGEGEQALREFTADQERVLLQPRLDAIERDLAAGPLRHFASFVRRAAPGAAMGLGVNLLAGTAGIASGANVAKSAADTWLDSRDDKGARPLWAALVRHNRGYGQQLQGVQERPGQNLAGPGYWGIPEQASMVITVSEGATLLDWLPLQRIELHEQGYSQGDYRPCDCGSGKKYRFCCRQIRLGSRY